MTIGKTLRATMRPAVRGISLIMSLSVLSMGASTAIAGSLTAKVTDGNGLNLEHAIVSLLGETPQTAPAGTLTSVDQRSRRFSPTVLPVQTGTSVSFPNTDDVRHHVYSFSQPNAFELKLYHGEPAKPVLFDEPGIVVLGCNIHDGMVGYLMVVDTPWYGATADDGMTRIDGLEAGQYTLQVWHPDLGMKLVKKALTLGKGDASIAIALDTPAAVPKSESVSPLQALFDY